MRFISLYSNSLKKILISLENSFINSVAFERVQSSKSLSICKQQSQVQKIGKIQWSNPYFTIQLPLIFVIIMKNQKHDQLADTQFFIKATQQIKQIYQNSIEEQATSRRLKKISLLKQQSNAKRQMSASSKYMKNLLIDYLRTNNLNYSYSVFMKQNDILSSEVIPQSQLIDFFSLSSFNSQEPFRVSCIQLILSKLSTLQVEKKMVCEFGIQVELLKNDKTVNNMVLNEIHLSSLRKQIEEKQKKHYENLLLTTKKSLSTNMKEDMKKEFQVKTKEMKAQYQRQVNALKEKNKQFLINNPKINPKVEQYVKRIEQLEIINMNTNIKLKELQKQKISHNCLKTPKIIARQKELQELQSQLTKKKQEYEFALSTLQTSVHNTAINHQKVFQPSKETDKFLADLKARKDTKDFMIDEMHGRMLIMDKRIDSFSSENSNLRELNRQLSSKITQLQSQSKQVRRDINADKEKDKEKEKEKDEKLKMFLVKPKVKNVSVGVLPADILESFREKKKQNVIDASELSEENSDQQNEAINRKTAIRLEANRIHSEMQICKNKLRFFVQQFQ